MTLVRPHPRAVLAALVLAGVLAGRVREASADSGIVVVGGTAVDRDRTTVSTAIESAAKQAGWSLGTRKLTAKETDSLVQCKDAASPWTCVPDSLGASGVDHVIVVSVERSQTEAGAPMVVIVGKLIVTSAKGFVVGRRFCEHCADDRLEQESSALAKEMLDELAQRSGHTVVEIKSEPTGAQIVLDGQRVGVTNATYSTFPGKHVVIIEHPGYASETRDVDVVDGKTAAIDVALRPEDGGEPRRPSAHGSRVPAAIAIGVGAAAVVAGGVLFVVDEDPSLTGEKRYFNSAPAGIGLAMGGAVAVAVGVVLWRRASSSSPSSPTAAVVHDGALVGWAGRF